MTARPVSLQRCGDQEIEIEWDDGNRQRLSVVELRRYCPCATCREKRSAKAEAAPKSMGLPVLSAAETRPLQVTAMRPVGNYAYNIAFSDDHDAGIYPFDLLYHWDERKSRRQDAAVD